MKKYLLKPEENLEEFINCFWILESEKDAKYSKIIGPLADGYPGIIFQPVEDGSYFDQDHKQLPEIFLYGQTVTRTKLYLRGDFRTIGISFSPSAIKYIFGFDAHEIADKCIDLTLLNKNIVEVLKNSASFLDRMGFFHPTWSNRLLKIKKRKI